MWSINPNHGPPVGRLTGFSLRYPGGMGNSIIFRIVCREIPVSRAICFWETLPVSARRRILVHWVTFLYIDEPPQTILTRVAWVSSHSLPTLGFAVGLRAKRDPPILASSFTALPTVFAANQGSRTWMY